MKIHSLHRSQFVPAGIDELFRFFEQPENLGKITPPWLRFRILTPGPLTMEEGLKIEYRISLGPMPIRWRTLIAHYSPPFEFTDVQTSGPYAIWHHRHRFTVVEGGTLIEDEVHYALPFGILGDVVHRLAIRRRVEAIFAHRARVIAALFPAATPMTIPPTATRNGEFALEVA